MAVCRKFLSEIITVHPKDFKLKVTYIPPLCEEYKFKPEITHMYEHDSYQTLTMHKTLLRKGFCYKCMGNVSKCKDSIGKKILFFDPFTNP